MAAFEAGIDFNVRLAATYVSEKIAAPLYRLLRTVHETVYPALVSALAAAAFVAVPGSAPNAREYRRGLLKLF